MGAEDYDSIDESTIEAHAGHPVTMILSVPLEHEDFNILSDIAERESKTVIDVTLDAIHAYAGARARRAAS